MRKTSSTTGAKKSTLRSGFEDKIVALLTSSKVNFKYEPTSFPYTLRKKYVPDLKIGDVFIECKGWFRPADRTKMLAVKRDNPALDIRLWFQQDNFLTKTKSKRYSDWAISHGFPFHVGMELPKKWFKSTKRKKR